MHPTNAFGKLPLRLACLFILSNLIPISDLSEKCQYHPKLAEIPALDGSQDVMLQLEDYPFSQ